MYEANGKYDQEAGDRYHALHARIDHTPGASLVAAVQTRAAAASQEEIEQLSGLLSRQADREDDQRPFSAEGLTAIGAMAHDWGERMLASGVAVKRGQIASIATLIGHAPSVALLPLLKKLLDDNLRRFRVFRAEAKANGWRQSEAVSEAQTPYTHEYQRAFLAIKAPETAALMENYLADEHFGQLAATVLALQWIEANEPKDDKKFRSGVDFSRVEDRRARRAADPAETSLEAEAIFRVIDSLIADGSTDEQKELAVALGIVAVRLPHGQRDATIQMLISLARRQARAALLLNLVLSGEVIDIKTVAGGVAEVFEAAKKETWILEQSDAYQLREWLRLLPFVNRPAELLAVVRSMPHAQRDPEMVGEMVDGLGISPADDAEKVLFKLAEEDPRFYQDYHWRSAVRKRGTQSAAIRLIDLAVKGALDGTLTSNRDLARELGVMIAEFPEVRAHAYDLLEGGPREGGLELLTQAVAENLDAEGLLLLIQFEIKEKRPRIGWLAIRAVVTEFIPADDLKGSYDVVPVPAVELRKRLLAMTTSGGVDDAASRYLNLIDSVRDEYGAPEVEPRHPDLASGRPWPILIPEPDAQDAS